MELIITSNLCLQFLHRFDKLSNIRRLIMVSVKNFIWLELHNLNKLCIIFVGSDFFANGRNHCRCSNLILSDEHAVYLYLMAHGNDSGTVYSHNYKSTRSRSTDEFSANECSTTIVASTN